MHTVFSFFIPLRRRYDTRFDRRWSMEDDEDYVAPGQKPAAPPTKTAIFSLPRFARGNEGPGVLVREMPIETDGHACALQG